MDGKKRQEAEKGKSRKKAKGKKQKAKDKRIWWRFARLVDLVKADGVRGIGGVKARAGKPQEAEKGKRQKTKGKRQKGLVALRAIV